MASVCDGEEKLFGERTQIMELACRGPISLDHAEAIPVTVEMAREIVALLGMNCSHPVHVAEYPVGPDGTSPGFIVVQCLYESLVYVDVWPRLQAFYLHCASCKEFDPEPVWDLLIGRGFAIQDTIKGHLTL